jgi:hypothetical protein
VPSVLAKMKGAKILDERIPNTQVKEIQFSVSRYGPPHVRAKYWKRNKNVILDKYLQVI